MRKIFLMFLAVAIAAGVSVFAQTAGRSENIQTHSEWLASSLKEMETIKSGMTRADLLKVFREEGGLSTRTHRQYVYHDCPYIKVAVEFEPVEKTDAAKFPEDASDKIVKISRPFIEWTITD